jgi:uncharacterized protein involved in exopolysaccharide biosynthesis
MTTINTSSMSQYASPVNLAVKKEADPATAQAVSEEKKTVGASLPPAEVKKSSGAGGGKSAAEETIEKIKEQIKQTQKQLAALQAQLAAAQGGSGTAEEKAQKAMAIQMQIASTNATLQTLQGALLQMMTSGGVNTTA